MVQPSALPRSNPSAFAYMSTPLLMLHSSIHQGVEENDKLDNDTSHCDTPPNDEICG